MTIRLTLTAFVAFLILFSCKKDDYQATNGKRLHKIINRWHDSLGYTMLKYDQQENLVEIKITSNNQPRDTTIRIINYDSQNKMAGYTYTHNLGSWPSRSFAFSNDSEGHIVSRVSTIGFKGHIYSYDKAGRLVADSAYYSSLNSFVPRTIFK